MGEQVPSEEKSFKELYEIVCKERNHLHDELRESHRRVNVCATEQEELQGMYNNMESLSMRLSDKLEQNQNEYSKAIVELHKRLDASESELASVKSEDAALSKRLEKMKQDKKSLSAEAKNAKAVLKRTLETHLRDDRKNSKTFSALQAQLRQSSVDLSGAGEEKERLDREIVQLRADHRSLKAEIAETREEKDGLNRRLELVESEKAALEESKAEMEKRMAETEEEIEKARSSMNTMIVACEESLKAAECERKALLEESGSLRARNSALENQRDEAEARATAKADAEKKLSEEKGRLSTLLSGARKSLVTMEIKKGALEKNAESEKREIKSRSEATKKSLERELLEAIGSLVTADAQKLHLEESNEILRERLAESEKRMEKERSDLARLRFESEESLKAVETERNALLEENGSLSDRRAEAETYARTLRTRLDELKALSQGWEEEKTWLIEEKQTTEKENKSLKECLRENTKLERKMLAENRVLMIRQEGLEKLVKDTLEVTTIKDDKENIKHTQFHKGSKKNSGLVLGSNVGSLPALSTPEVPSRPPLTPTDPRVRDSSAMRRRIAIDP